VRGEAEQVDAQVVDVEREVGAGLDGIGVEEDAAPPADGADLGDRLDGADLVVGVHDRDKGRVLVDRRVDLLRVDPAVSVNRHDRDLEAGALQDGAGVQHRFVLNPAGHDVPALGACRPGGALDGEVIGLAAATGEDDLARLGAEDLGDPLPGLVEPLPGAAARGVQARRVAVMLG
jgi:hypothetical protein